MSEEPAKYDYGQELEQEMKKAGIPYNKDQFCNSSYCKWALNIAESVIKSGRGDTPEEIAEFAVQTMDRVIEKVKLRKAEETWNFELKKKPE